MTKTQLEPGCFVTQTVKLVRPLAEGGMGRVWLAEHLGLDAEVVVKLMADEMAARPDGAERFAREAAIAAAIKSPHAVQVFDHGVTAEGTPYIVMERLEGRDLSVHLAHHGRMDPTDVVTLVVQVGKALSRAHKASIVHRDIKPENIFLCDTDGGEIFAKLLDFGTARRDTPSRSRTTVPGQIMGTPYYMSPEQSVGGAIDERSDIWSLGVVAFEALTGQKPFDGASVGAITIAIHGALPRMTDLVPELPPSLDAWFERACAQAPSERFATVREMTSALAMAVTGSAPVDVPTESVCFPSVQARGASTPARPVTRPIAPLSASLPAPGAAQRPTKIAAALVMAATAAAMIGIVLRSPAAPPADDGVAAQSTLNAAAQSTLNAAAPASGESPEALAAAAEPAAAPPDTPPAPPPASPVARSVRPGSGAAQPSHAAAARAKTTRARRAGTRDAGVPGAAVTGAAGTAPAAHEDDDLARLTKAASQHAEPFAAPSSALPPASEGAAPPALPEPPALPSVEP